MKKIGWLICIVMAISACKQEAEPEVAPVIEEVVPEVIYYQVTVDKLRGRSMPGRKSEVITKISEGTVVKFLDQVSDFKDKITLRGKEYNEPYRLVELEDGKQVWLYGGALKKYYAGPEMEEPDQVAALQDFIKTLPTDKEEAGNLLLKKLLTLSTDDKATNDMLLFKSWDYLHQLASGVSQHADSTLAWADEHYYQYIADRSLDMESNPKTIRLMERGLRLDAAEGMVYYVPDITALDGAIGGVFTDGTKAYIQLLDNEYRHGLFRDAAIVGNMNDLADDAIAWSQFVKKYPTHPQINLAREKAKYYKEVILFGTDNTPAFSLDKNIAEPKFRKMWQYIAKKHNRTELGGEVEGFYNKTKNNAWKLNVRIQK